MVAGQTTTAADIAAIQSISSVPTVLSAIRALTGVRFVCVARVTPDSWTACAVLDDVAFGLGVGGELPVATTMCRDVMDARTSLVISQVRDDARYCAHATPRMYGFQSYFSIPLWRPDGSFFGTLCGIDPEPRQLNEQPIYDTLHLFADLISRHLHTEAELAQARTALLGERETAELREQFVAVLGHDLRSPLGTIVSSLDLLERQPVPPGTARIHLRIRQSVLRMAALVDDVVDFARGRMGGGIPLQLVPAPDLQDRLAQVVDEVASAHRDTPVRVDIAIPNPPPCDVRRLQQLLANLLKNALVHGDPGQPVAVLAGIEDGQLRIVVRNHGQPIPPAAVAQLFKPFWRAARGGGSDGLGLGLFIASEIARGHGGTLDVSCAGGMVEFQFAMPVPAAAR